MGFSTLSIVAFLRSLDPGNDLLFYYRVFYHYLGSFFVGASLWSMYQVVVMSRQIPTFKLKVTVYQYSGAGVQQMGNLFLRMSLAICIPFALILVVAMLSPFGSEYIILGWLGFAALSLVAFFLIPQIGVHRIMTREKQQRLTAFATHMEQAMEKSLHDPNPENMARLKESFEVYQYLNNMKEWPFNANAIWQLVTALLIPLGIALVEFFVKD
jgi:hypothetical protein